VPSHSYDLNNSKIDCLVSHAKRGNTGREIQTNVILRTVHMIRGVSRAAHLTFLLSLGVALMNCFSLNAQTSSTVRAVPLVTQVVNEDSRVALTGNVHPFAVARYDQGEASQSTPTGRIQLVLSRSQAQQQALVQYLADVHNPNSPGYHKWLTPAEYGAKFGIDDSDLQTVEAWLQSHGFKIERVPQARNVIEFSGTFGQIESALHTPIHTFQVNGARHFANTANPQIPAALRPVIAGVGPLHDFRPASQAKFNGPSHYDTTSRSIKPDLTLFTSTGTPYLYVDPADAATIYDTPNAALNPNYTGTTYDGTGVNIGILGDSNFTMQDVLNYRMAFLGETSTSANLPTVVVDGVDPGINGDEGEALLDNEIAGGIAPKASLYFYTANNTDLQTGVFDAFVRALDDNQVSILNFSFGECEAGLGNSGNQFVLELMEQAVAQGISVTVSTGDSGAAGCDRSNETTAVNGLAVNGLASTPYNIAVGGTDYDALQSNFSTYASTTTSGSSPYFRTALSYIPERPWNDSTTSNDSLASNAPFSYEGATNVIGAGGGISSCVNSVTDGAGNITCQSGYPKPAFQTSLTPNDSVRDLPDVAFLAGNGFYNATWVVCADNVANGTNFPPYTDCQLSGGAFTRETSFSGYGGTSAATPTLAGILALIEQKTGSRLGQADYVLYQPAASKYSAIFHDVTDGNNSVVCSAGTLDCGDNGFLTGYDAGIAYDLASGLGSIDAMQLLNNWNSAGLIATTTSLKINGSTAAVNVTHGTSLTFDAAVSPSASTGVVGIVDNANENSSGVKNNGQTLITLSGGSGATTYNGLPGGSYTVYGYYGGDASNASSTSSGIPVTISAEDSIAALSISAYTPAGTAIPSLSGVPYGSYFVATTQIEGKAEGASSQGIATGSVSLTDNGASLATDLPLNAANLAAYESPTSAYPSAFTIGSHSIVANYAGDASYKATSSSTPVPITIVKGGTFMDLSATSTSINTETATQLTVGVGTNGLGAYPTGTVVLTSNGKTLATVTSFNPGASSTGGNESLVIFSIQGSALSAGANTITASYSGDSNYTAATGAIAINVTQSSFSLSSSGSISVAGGATASNTSTIYATPSNGFIGVINLSCAVTTSPANASNAPTCSIPSTINITGTSSVPATLSVQTATDTTPGSYVVTITGVDATRGKISAAANVSLTVTGTASPASFSLGNSGGITIAPGATNGNTSAISITPSGGFTGQVNLSCAVTTSIANPTSTPTCVVPASVTVSGGNATTASLTVSSTAPTTTAATSILKLSLPGTMLAVVIFLGVPTRRPWTTLAVAVILLSSIGWIGCGGGSGSSGKTTTTTGGSTGGTTAGTYTVTVTGVDAATGKITANTAVTVTVN